MAAFGASAKMQPPSAPGQAFEAACSARLGRRIDAIPVVHSLQGALMRRDGLAVSDARIALPKFDNIAIRIANIAARLAVLGLRLRDELGSPASPQFIASLNIGNADIHKAAHAIRIGGDTECDRRLVGCRTTADVDDEPRVRDLEVSWRAIAVASAQDAGAKDLFVKSGRSFDIGDNDKVRDGNACLRRHLIAFLSDL